MKMCDRQESLVGYLYDEVDEREKREFDAHLAFGDGQKHHEAIVAAGVAHAPGIEEARGEGFQRRITEAGAIGKGDDRTLDAGLPVQRDQCLVQHLLPLSIRQYSIRCSVKLKP